MRRWALGLLLYAVVAVGCDDDPPPNGGDANEMGEDAGEDAGMTPDDTGVIGDPDSGVEPGDTGMARDTGMVITDVCDPVQMTGCDTPPNTKCVIEGGAPGTECVPESPNDVGLGEACTGRDCEAGLVCLRDAATATTSSCRQACNLDTNMGCEGLAGEFECRTAISASNWGACTQLPPLCDPYTQDPCQQDQACQPFLRRTGAWEFRCRTAGQLGEGTPCGPGNNCQRGLACVNEGGSATCRRFCQVDGDCTAPQQCTGNVPDPAFMFCRE